MKPYATRETFKEFGSYGTRRFITVFTRNLKTESLGRLERSCENNFKTELMETECKVVDWPHLAQNQ
jgi:hypothetical protein